METMELIKIHDQGILKPKLNNKDLIVHERAVAVSKRYLKSESELIASLIEIDQNKICYKLGYSSLTDYARRVLKLSDDTAQNFVTVARKAFLVPELKVAIDEGSLTVSKARKLAPVINPSNQAHWLELAKSSTQKNIEKEVAKVQPMAAVVEQAKYVSGDTLKVTSAFSEKVYKMLKHVQDLESRKPKKNLSINDTLDTVLSGYLAQNDRLERAERQEEKVKNDAPSPDIRLKTEHSRQTETQEDIPFQRSSIPTQLKRQVIHRDKDKCQHQYYDGSICENQRFIEIHHKIPISHGGQNQIQNLITLCSGHHKAQHMNS